MRCKLNSLCLCAVFATSAGMNGMGRSTVDGDGDSQNKMPGQQTLRVTSGGLIRKETTKEMQVAEKDLISDGNSTPGGNSTSGGNSSSGGTRLGAIYPVKVKHDPAKTFKDSGDDCHESHLVQGNMCEEVCAWYETNETFCHGPCDSRNMSKAAGLSPGSCPKSGFNIKITEIKVAIFARHDEHLGSTEGSVEFTEGCEPHYIIKGALCDMFCGGSKDEMTHFLEHHKGIKKGTCFAVGYEDFMGHGVVTAYQQPQSTYQQPQLVQVAEKDPIAADDPSDDDGDNAN